MPCYKPMQAGYSLDEKKVYFSESEWLVDGSPASSRIFLPCGQCLGCRLTKSRDWGLRCLHEAKMHSRNSFLTLTFSPEGLQEMCPTGSLSRRHVSDFMKRLRKKFGYESVRYFGCGEYGPKLGRPHYHLCLFGFDFEDKTLWRKHGQYSYYVSGDLQRLWPYGFSTIGDLTFESAAYVARYCVKKVTGLQAEEHYKKVCSDTGDERLLQKEFAAMSLRPGIGFSWFEKFGESDVIPHDSCILKNSRCPVPRYYDKLWERKFPASFAKAKAARILRAELRADDNSDERLAVRLICQQKRFDRLCRTMENSL